MVARKWPWGGADDELITQVMPKDPPRHSKIYELRLQHPGTVRAWMVRHNNPTRSDLIINLVSYRQLRRDWRAGRMWRRRGDPFRMGTSQGFEVQFLEYLDSRGLDRSYVIEEGRLRLDISHVVVVFWRGRVPRDLSPPSRREYTTRPIVDVPCDLHDGAYDPGDRYAIPVCASLVIGVSRHASIDILGEHWTARVDQWDWINQVDLRAKSLFGQSHSIHPTPAKP